MLEAFPYADVLAINNALSEKPARRFDTRANGEKRTLALMEARNLSLEDAARLAGVVIGASDQATSEPPADEPADEPETPPDAPAMDEETTITIGAALAPLVTAFMVELTKPDRPAYLTSFLRSMNGHERATLAPRERQMTESQKTIIDLCVRPEGATGRELAAVAAGHRSPPVPPARSSPTASAISYAKRRARRTGASASI